MSNAAEMLGTLAPAPWRFDGHGINDNEGQRVAKVSCCEPYEYPDGGPKRNVAFDNLSNLIAAAPEMGQTLIEELDAIRVWLGAETNADITDGMFISIDKIQTALKKAGLL